MTSNQTYTGNDFQIEGNACQMSRTSAVSGAVLASVVAIAMTGCATTATTSAQPSGSGSPAATSDVKVVASTTMLGNIAQQITDCGGGTTTTLMPQGTDPHEFALSSQQATELVKAKLVVVNGLGLEHSFESVLDNATKDGAHVLTVADKVDPLPFEHDEAEHEHESSASPSASPTAHDHDHESTSPAPSATTTESAHKGHAGEEEHHHGDKDPHFWLDATRDAKAATVIGNELATVTGNQKYTECAKTVHDQLMDVNTKVTQILASIPADKRVLITDHEAFGYFAKQYKFEIAGVVVPGGSTEGEPSSADIAALVKVIKDRKIRAIFSNTTINPKLVEQVAKEVGGQVKVVPLYAESLDDAHGIKSVGDMLTKNAELIADALKQS